MSRLVRQGVVALFVVSSACGGDDSKRAEGTSNTGSDAGDAASGGGGGATPPEKQASDGGGMAPDGCTAPPSESFDPLATYVAPPLTPSVVVVSTADAGPGSLREAVAKGGVVGFAPELAGKTITLKSTIELGPSVTVDGSGAKGITVDADDKVRAFRFNGDAPTKLAFFSLTIARGRTTGSGGAISINGGSVEVEIGGVRFASNVAGEGGALRVGYRSAQAFVHDSVFINNDGSTENSGFSGGAISASGGNLRVSRCRFEGNVGSTTGAVYSIHANPVIEDSVFVANRSSGDRGSGAFFTDGGGPGDYNNKITTRGEITLRRSLFTKNRGAGDDGGAAELYAYPPDEVTVEGCAFRSNEAKPGRAGALFIHADKSVDIRQTVFVDNRATGPGAAIWADGVAVYTLENDLFSGNISASDLGGALRLNIGEAAKLRIASATFVDNVATNGNGALWLPGKRDVRVTNSIFAKNSAKGGAQQINFAVTEDGGNLLWPAPQGSSTLPSASIADPMLGELTAEGSSWARVPAAGSPAIDKAVVPAPTVDQRGARRDATSDIGSFEVGAACGAR